MYTFTIRLWMGEFSICVYAHTDDGWVNAQYLYMHIQTMDMRMLNMYTCTFRRCNGDCSICSPVTVHLDDGWLNAKYVYLHIQTVDG